MAKRRTTTIDELIDIVSYCISNGKDYGKVVEQFGVSYHQVYTWVRIYEARILFKACPV
jgi:transposase